MLARPPPACARALARPLQHYLHTHLPLHTLYTRKLANVIEMDNTCRANVEPYADVIKLRARRARRICAAAARAVGTIQ